MAETALVVGYTDNPAPQVEAAFRVVHQTRMQDVPILNPAISVEAVDFAPWEAHWLGCLVTPWFMNLMLLPRVTEQWIRLRPGEKHTYAFPAGAFEFIAGKEQMIGEYHACSLFSPMLEFADHETARLTAFECLHALFDEQNVEHADVSLVQKSDSLREPSKDADELEAAAVEADSIEAKLEAPLTKREFLRGKFLEHGARR